MTNNNDNHTPSGTAGTRHRRSPHSEHYSRPVQIRLPGKDFSVQDATIAYETARQTTPATQGAA